MATDKKKYKYEIVNGNEYKLFKTKQTFKKYCISKGIWTDETSGFMPHTNEDLHHQPILKNMAGPMMGNGWPVRYEDWDTCMMLSK